MADKKKPVARRVPTLTGANFAVWIVGEPDPDRVNWARLRLLGYEAHECDRIIGLMRAKREQEAAYRAANEAGAESS